MKNDGLLMMIIIYPTYKLEITSYWLSEKEEKHNKA